MKNFNFKNYIIKEIIGVSNDDLEGYVIYLKNKEGVWIKIEIYIDNSQCCCEEIGYVSSEDNFKNFIGAELKEVYTTGVNKETTIINFFKNYTLDAGDIMFLTLVTSKGILQFAVYNSHNGYYGHRAIIKIDEKIVEEKIL